MADYNIRVVNVSVGASVLELYLTDPLTLAGEGTVDAGIIVVGAGGKPGKDVKGSLQLRRHHGAPGNAPWVLTVGASSTKGRDTRRRHGRELQLERP